MSLRITDIYGNHEIVKGRADWAVGYGANKSDTGAILLVVEAKPYDAAAIGMPQLLVYMAAVQKARQERNNKSVFGMVSDGNEFRFAFLDEQKKLFISKLFIWVVEKSTIIAYIDMMLTSAIESSPHTTPQKKNNRTIRKYPEYLEKQWDFGTQSDDRETEEAGRDQQEQEEEEEEEEEDHDTVDVVKIDGRVVMRASKHHSELRSPE